MIDLIPPLDWFMGFAGGLFAGWLAWRRPAKKFAADVEAQALAIQKILENAERR